MMDELLVIIGAELILLVSIAAMSLRGRRMDVLSGHYLSNKRDRAILPGWNIGRLRRWVEREREANRLRKARSRRPIIPASDEVDDHAVRRVGEPGTVREARDGLGLR